MSQTGDRGIDPPFEGTGTRLCLFGAAPDTGNLGVCALGTALAVALTERLGDAVDLTFFDHGRGERNHVLPGEVAIHRIGATPTRRPFRPQSWRRLAHAVANNDRTHPGARRFLDADAILDVSAGDSFTDLYGPKRFRAIAAPKQLALAHDKPLILLPQTYGQFRDQRHRAEAATYVREATMAWARDDRSFDVLRELAGDRFDAERHRCGVDLAFRLPAHPPADGVSGALRRWLDGAGERVAINASGLLHNADSPALAQPKFSADSTQTVLGLITHILETSDANVLLVPHVTPGYDHPESDPRAGARLAARLRDAHPNRIECLLPGHDECMLKWIIAQASWFCGGRMHSTIAALSSGVPAAVLAYSPKPHGVFSACDLAASVTDLRTLDTEAATAHLIGVWNRRNEDRQTLARGLQGVMTQANDQIDRIAHAVTGDVWQRRAA